MQEIAGLLASGNAYHATRQKLEVFTPAGQEIRQIPIADIETVERDGSTLTLGFRKGSELALSVEVLSDAIRLESALRSWLPKVARTPNGSIPASMPARPRTSTMVRLRGLIGVAGVLALVYIFVQAKADADTIVASDEGTVFQFMSVYIEHLFDALIVVSIVICLYIVTRVAGD